MTAQRVVAFVYDRHTTPGSESLRARLEACSRYAREQGWEIGGWHVDKGDDAVTHDVRPALDAAVRLMDRVERGRPRVLLVFSRGRLHNHPRVQQALAARAEMAGGSVVAVMSDGSVLPRPMPFAIGPVTAPEYRRHPA